MTIEPGEELLDVPALARRIVSKAHPNGVQPGTVWKMLGRARANRAAGTPKPGDLPEPDLLVAGRHPLWKASTIDAYLPKRPGHGWRAGHRSGQTLTADGERA